MTKRKFLLIGFVLVLAGLLVTYRLYNKPHPSALTASAITVTAQELVTEYEKDESAANKKYLGQALQVSGTVSDISQNQQHRSTAILTGTDMAGVQCSFEMDPPLMKKGDKVVLKGFCTGMLTDVIIDRCVLIQ